MNTQKSMIPKALAIQLIIMLNLTKTYWLHNKQLIDFVIETKYTRRCKISRPKQSSPLLIIVKASSLIE